VRGGRSEGVEVLLLEASALCGFRWVHRPFLAGPFFLSNNALHPSPTDPLTSAHLLTFIFWSVRGKRNKVTGLCSVLKGRKGPLVSTNPQT